MKNKMIENITSILKTIDDKFKTIISNNVVLSKMFMVLPKNIFLFIFFVITFIYIGFIFNQSRMIVTSKNDSSNSNVGPIITNPYEIKTEELGIDYESDYVCFKFATYSRKNSSIYSFDIKKDNTVIYSQKFNSSKLKDGKYKCFSLKKIEKNEKYIISINPLEVDYDNAITIFSDNNNKTSYKVIKKRLLTKNSLFVLIFAIIGFIINFLINKKKINVYKVWTIFCILYLIPVVFINPAYEVPDEPVHFYSAYKITQLDLTNFRDSLKTMYIIAPSNINCINYATIEVEDRVYDYDDIFNCFKNNRNFEDHKYEDYNYVKTKLGYIFSGAGIFIADKLTNSPLTIFFAGRLLNAIVCMLIIGLALRITPKYKYFFLLLATMPMFIQQLCSYNYDSIVFSLNLLIISFIMSMIYSKKNTIKKYSMPLLLCSIVISDIKSIYLSVLLLLLFIPNSKFKNKYYKYLYTFVLIIISFIIGRVTLNTMSLPSTEPYLNGNFNYLLSNPTMIFRLIYNTFKINGLFYYQSLIGYFGWFKIKIPYVFLIMYLLMFIYIIRNNSRNSHTTIEHIIVICGWLLTFAAIFGAMYFNWSDEGMDYIDGVQGRYFIPMIFSFLYLFMNRNTNKSEEYEKNVMFFSNFIIFYYIILLIGKYYIGV